MIFSYFTSKQKKQQQHKTHWLKLIADIVSLLCIIGSIVG